MHRHLAACPALTRAVGRELTARGNLWQRSPLDRSPLRQTRKGPDLLDKTIEKPPRRTRFVDAIQGGTRLAMKAGLVDPATFDRQAMMDHAAEQAGSDDFGDPWFEKPLSVLLESLEQEAQLHEAGAWFAVKQCEKVLVDRLRAEQWFARHPEILARPLRNPVFVVGPMRSGTTRLHRLLAADRRFAHMRSFETICPVPYPDFTHGGHDHRVTIARRARMVANLANPKTLSIHPTGPKQPEEELGLLVNSFWGMKHEAQWHVPSYGQWCEDQDATPVYGQMARLLKLIGWSQQESSLKPWVLKTPQHMLDLDALVNVFPDARFIFTHRDPIRVVASSASLAWNQPGTSPASIPTMPTRTRLAASGCARHGCRSSGCRWRARQSRRSA